MIGGFWWCGGACSRSRAAFRIRLPLSPIIAAPVRPRLRSKLLTKTPTRRRSQDHSAAAAAAAAFSLAAVYSQSRRCTFLDLPSGDHHFDRKGKQLGGCWTYQQVHSVNESQSTLDPLHDRGDDHKTRLRYNTIRKRSNDRPRTVLPFVLFEPFPPVTLFSLTVAKMDKDSIRQITKARAKAVAKTLSDVPGTGNLSERPQARAVH